MKDDEKKVLKIFCPSVPMTDPSRFVGREHERRQLRLALLAPGRHAVVFGARGVGKTSSAKFVAQEICKSEGYQFVEYTCSSDDSSVDICRKILEEIGRLSYERTTKQVTERSADAGLDIAVASTKLNTKQTTEIEYPETIQPGKLSPDRLCSLIGGRQLIISIDEYDRVLSAQTRRFFADTIKALSDKGSSCKFLITGVSNSANELIGDHASNIRNIQYVKVPLMNESELRRIIDNGLRALNIGFTDDLKDAIVFLSRGLPYYTHRICEELAIEAISRHLKNVGLEVLELLIPQIAENASDWIRSQYDAALMDEYTFSEFGPEAQKNPEYSEEIRRVVLYGIALARSGDIMEITHVVTVLVNQIDIDLPTGHLEVTTDLVITVANDIARISDCISLERDSGIEFKNAFIHSFCLFKAMATYPQAINFISVFNG